MWQINKHRSHFIYFINLKIKKIFAILIIFIIFTTTWITYYFIESALRPLAIRNIMSDTSIYCEKMINKAISKTLTQKYDDFCTIEKNESGQITSIFYNTKEINRIKTLLSESIVKSVENMAVMENLIPLGNLTNSILLSERGPKIPVKILPNGNPRVELTNDFISVGINQTKHKISVKVGMEIEIIFAGTSTQTIVNTEFPISETIIVGNIPNVYGLK